MTFEDLSERTGVPVESLMVIREAIGSAVPDPTDRVRETELAIVPLIEAQLASGYALEVVERLLRTMGDNLRTFVLAEADDFRAYVIEPVTDRPGVEISAAAGCGRCTVGRADRPGDPRGAPRPAGARLDRQHPRGLRARPRQARVCSSRVETPPAMCFLDLTGYTSLTAERGDGAAAELAEQLRRLVQRTSVQHGGRPVKWLGDGVMFWFRDPGRGVVAALEMADGSSRRGCRPRTSAFTPDRCCSRTATTTGRR